MNAFMQSGPPWFGNSLWRDRGTVGRYGRWDSEKRQYKAMTEHALLKLLETGLWCPAPVLNHKEQFLEYLQARKVEHEVEQARIRKEQDAAEKSKAIAKMRLEEQEEKQRVAKRARDDRIRQLAKNYQVRKDLDIPEDQPEIVQELVDKYGVTAEQIAVSEKISQLGPRAGMSDAERVRRAFQLGGGAGIMPHNKLRKLLADFARIPAACSL